MFCLILPKADIKSYLTTRDVVPKYLDALYDAGIDTEHYWKGVAKPTNFDPTPQSTVQLGLSPNLASKVSFF